MADKRDYYEVLGVAKNASDADIKKHSVTLRRSIIQMHIQGTKNVKKNLKKLRKRMPYSAMQINVDNMINLVMLLLMALVAQEDLTSLVWI